MSTDQPRTVLRYWEIRRVIYNLLLIPPAWFAWQISGGFTVAIDDHLPARIDDPFVIRSIIYLLMMANVCYSIVYMLEFLFASPKVVQGWRIFGRPLVFVSGCIFAMLLAGSNSFSLQTAARGDWIEPRRIREKDGAPNEAVDPTPVSAPRNSGGSSED